MTEDTKYIHGFKVLSVTPHKIKIAPVENDAQDGLEVVDNDKARWIDLSVVYDAAGEG